MWTVHSFPQCDVKTPVCVHLSPVLGIKPPLQKALVRSGTNSTPEMCEVHLDREPQWLQTAAESVLSRFEYAPSESSSPGLLEDSFACRYRNRIAPSSRIPPFKGTVSRGGRVEVYMCGRPIHWGVAGARRKNALDRTAYRR